MNERRRPRGAAAALVLAALIVGLQAPVAASADPSYPSWDDVQRAKGNEAAKAAEISKIEKLIQSLETKDADLGKQASVAAENVLIAQAALDAAQRKEDTLAAQAKTAGATADASELRAKRLLAQLARQGGGDVTLSLLQGDAKDTEKTLYKLGIMSRLSGSSSAVFAQADYDRKNADALTADAASAKKARDAKKKAAASALAAAQKAQTDVESRLKVQDESSKTLYAQLASLKDTTAEVEKAYQDGLAWERAQEAAKTPPAPPASGNTGSPSNPPVTPDTPPAPPVTGVVDTAIAYAKAQLGEPYVINGAGPSGWDCSGLTMMSYSAAGVSIGGHGSNLQYNYLAARGRLVTLANMQPGDLLFYSDGGAVGGSKYHVTMYIGGGQMIEAAYPGTNVRIKAVRYGDLVPYAGRPTG
ncbi:NlpC/P60 family protein [Schumannella sp. 10F1B-5-1]|uniref:C40 family peptidase n=1 Tax=Schumannella sp. 10F1B-5-1 TaxID=2590780 RepID=UPI0011328ABC|nr:C40 family peptidase [Schumannella sp. 10F1B-5-1]TPW71621.1 NlpC/P60 family protein [Schumannella sp. 10F1B-5-1]